MRLLRRSFALVVLSSALGSPGSARADSGDDRFAVAADHYGKKQWQQACDDFAKLLAAEPDHPRAQQARFFYGEALAQLNRWSDARAQFAALLKRDANHRYARQALFRGGEAAYLGGDDGAARADFAAFRDRFPDDTLNGYVLPYLANLELQDGDAAAASKWFLAALDRFPEGPLADDCRLGLARAAEKSGRIDDARSGFRAIAESDSSLADQGLMHWVTLENGAGDYQAALSALDRLGVRFPNSPLDAPMRLARGYALHKSNRRAEAETVLTGLLPDPGVGVEAHYWLGMSRRAQGQLAAAAETLLDGAKIAPEHRLAPALVFHAADALEQQGQHALAREQLDRVLLRWPKSAWADDALLGKLRIATAEKDHAECVRLADELAARFPDSPLQADAQLAKGQALFALAKYAEAGNVFERVWTRFSDSPAALQAALGRGRALEQLNQPDQALASYRLVADRYSQSGYAAEALWRAARLSETMRQPDAAAKFYATLVEKYPDFPQLDAALGHWAGLLMASNQATQAEAVMARLRRDFPGSAYATDSSLHLAASEISAGKLDEAQSLLSQIDTSRATAAVRQQVWHLEGRLAFAGKKWDAVEGPLAQSIAILPDSDLALASGYLIAEAAYHRGDHAAAATRFAELSAKTQGRSDAWIAQAELRWARALAQAKEWSQARDVAQRIAARFPNFDQQNEVDYLIGRSLAAEADFAGARAAYEKVVASPQAAGSPWAAMAQWMIGESYFHQENYAAALAEYAKVDARYPYARWRAAALLQGAKCQEFLDRWPAAVAAYEQLLKTFPDSEYAAEGKERLVAAERHVSDPTKSPK